MAVAAKAKAESPAKASSGRLHGVDRHDEVNRLHMFHGLDCFIAFRLFICAFSIHITYFLAWGFYSLTVAAKAESTARLRSGRLHRHHGLDHWLHIIALMLFI